MTVGELRRMTQFKDKSKRNEAIRGGLFTYPVLMAADILLYDTEVVPVGDDQRQHLELAREIAERFNNRFGETFVVPAAMVPTVAARVMDLQDPTKKMSKSEDSPQGTVLLFDEPDVVARKIRRAVTDTDGVVRYDPASKPGVSNLLEILAALKAQDPHALADGVLGLRAAQGRRRRGRHRGPRADPRQARRAARRSRRAERDAGRGRRARSRDRRCDLRARRERDGTAQRTVVGITAGRSRCPSRCSTS